MIIPYYLDNNIINDLFNNYHFELVTQEEYLGHSVFFTFKRNDRLQTRTLRNIDFSFDSFFEKIFHKKREINAFIKKNKEKHIGIWPASVHTQFLFTFLGTNNIEYILDNSPTKIDKYLYGYTLKCINFNENINNPDFAVILNGCVFNNEVKSFVTNDNVLYIN